MTRKFILTFTCLSLTVAFSLYFANAQNSPVDIGSVDVELEAACRYAKFIGNDTCKASNSAEVCDCE